MPRQIPPFIVKVGGQRYCAVHYLSEGAHRRLSQIAASKGYDAAQLLEVAIENMLRGEIKAEFLLAVDSRDLPPSPRPGPPAGEIEQTTET